MAHLTGCETRGVLAIKDLPNVFLDTSGGPPVEGLVEYAVDQLGPDRVNFQLPSSIGESDHRYSLNWVDRCQRPAYSCL